MPEVAANAMAIEANACRQWYVDSGATQHMTSNRRAFKTYREMSPSPVSMADGKTIKAIDVGKISIELKTGNTMREGVLQEVLYVPELHGSLFSVTKTTALGNSVEFGKNGCAIRNRAGRIIATAVKKGNLYELLTANGEWRNAKTNRSPNHDRNRKQRRAPAKRYTKASPESEAKNQAGRDCKKNDNERTHRTADEVIWINLTPSRKADDAANTEKALQEDAEPRSTKTKNVEVERTSKSECADDNSRNDRNDNINNENDNDIKNAAHSKTERAKRKSTRKKNSPDRYAPK
jgi:hypothetical protein